MLEIPYWAEDFIKTRVWVVRLARILSIVVEAEAYRGHRFWFKDSPFGFYTMISLCCMSSQ